MDLEESFVHLARLALLGRQDDVAALVRRALPKLVERRPDLSKIAGPILRQVAVGTGPARATPPVPLPVDADSRLELLRRELVETIDPEPVWPGVVQEALNSVLLERRREQELAAKGLTPTKSLLFLGPPGVGKTLAARWLSRELRRPLLTLDLAAVMSSFLGRTGNNIRVVLDFARRSPSVLLLDEFDAIAKRRDDSTEIGELKRLVTVLLQSVDDWPSDGLLIAATNHPELLDPAVWRRFDLVVNFPVPGERDVRLLIRSCLGDNSLSDTTETALSCVLEGRSFAEITRELNRALRRSLLNDEPVADALLALAAEASRDGKPEMRMSIAKALIANGWSMRAAAELTRVSRDTMRAHGVGKERRKS